MDDKGRHGRCGGERHHRESATLDDKEKMAVIRYAVRQVDGRIPVIAGTGSNCTEHAVELSRKAQELGADALLQVTPYYNKASQEGLVRHFTQVADHVRHTHPFIQCAQPYRGNHTAGNLQDSVGTSQYTGTKEASGNLSLIARTAALCGQGFDIYSGNDDQTVPIMSLGGKGCGVGSGQYHAEGDT